MSDRFQATTLDSLSANDRDLESRVGNGAAGPLALAGRYELQGLLGVGGMGTVYRARDIELDEPIAIKILRRELVADPGMLDRFRREVKLARRVTHRNVARVYDIGEHQSDKFLTMELIEGESLAILLAREHVLPLARIVSIVCAVCDGLAAAHAAGVVHRDLKPENVLLGTDGRVVVTDFGIARAFGGDTGSKKTIGAVVLGTPQYMAPEQVEAKADIDGRADIYALGTMLYEMLTGEPAWQGDSALGIAAARLVSEPPDPRQKAEVPDALARLVLRCMARAPAMRVARVDEVSRVLASLTLPLKRITERPARRSLPPDATRTSPGAKSLAVIPVRNTGDASGEPFALGLAELLTEALAGEPSLRVRSRGEVGRIRDTERDLRVIGRELDVQVVLGGTVRREADGALRVLLRLVSVSDGFQLWAATFERPVEALFDVVREATSGIARALATAAPPPLAEATRDPRAVELCLRARSEEASLDPLANDRAVAIFEQAIALAPSDYWINAGYAASLTRRFFDSEAPAEEAFEAEAMATRAIASAPSSVEARVTLARLRLAFGDAAGGASHLAYVRGRSGHADLNRLAGAVLVECGAIERGCVELRAATMLEPHALDLRSAQAIARALEGEWSLADAILDGVPVDARRSADYFFAAMRVAAWSRARDRARELLAACAARPFARRDIVVLCLQALDGGAFSSAAAMLERCAEDAGPVVRRRVFYLQLLAEIAACVGDVRTMVSALEAFDRAGAWDIAWLERCPLLAQRAIDPALVARVRARAAYVLDAMIGAGVIAASAKE